MITRTPAVQFTFELTVIKLRPNSRSTLQKSSGWIQKIPVIVRKFIISVMLDSGGAVGRRCNTALQRDRWPQCVSLPENTGVSRVTCHEV